MLFTLNMNSQNAVINAWQGKQREVWKSKLRCVWFILFDNFIFFAISLNIA